MLRLGDTALEIGEGTQPGLAAAAFVMDVDDVDAMYAQALEAGAAALQAPAPQAFGRMGAVTDPWGNEWYLTGSEVNG